MSKGNTIAGLLVGLAAGAALGVLFAPEKGSDTRKKIASKGKDSLDDLKNKYNNAIDQLTSKLDKAKNNGLEMFEEGKAYAENVKK
jgi:gas vesicle protein